MNSKESNIHPIFDRLISTEEKEQQLKQKASVFWFTGLSGSGKSTIALGVEQALHQKGFFSKLLDGDNVRTGINNNLGFEAEDRKENIRRISEVAKLFREGGVVCLCSFVSPTNEFRNLARSIVGEENFHLVFVNTPLEECEKRDVKGLYAKARAGEIKNFTGIDAPFEIPEGKFLEINTTTQSISESIDEVLAFIQPKIQLK